MKWPSVLVPFCSGFVLTLKFIKTVTRHHVVVDAPTQGSGTRIRDRVQRSGPVSTCSWIYSSVPLYQCTSVLVYQCASTAYFVSLAVSCGLIGAFGG